MTDMAQPERLQIGDWRVDVSTGVLTRGTETARLEPKVMRVLVDLASHAGEVRSKDALIASVWDDAHVGEAALSRCISELRKTLGDDAREPRYIETLPKRGYRLVASVDAIAPDTKSLPGAPEPPRSRPVWQTALAGAIVLVMFVLWWRTVPQPAPGQIERIAVLPLRALSDDGEQRFFAEGLTEQLIANLATIESIRVVSGRAARLARDADASGSAIAEALGVDAVVDGTVQRSSNRTVVSLELIQAPGDRLVWGGSYQERGDDWMEIQNEVAVQATREIAVALASLRGLPTVRPENPEARQELDRGRLLATRGNPVDSVRSLDHFRRALEIDPEYALAWAHLADAHATLAWRNWSLPATAYAEARSAAHTALDLQPRLAEAHAILAAVAAERNQDWLEAERRFQTAIELDPESAFAHERYGRYLRRLGRYEDAVVRTGESVALEPDAPHLAVSHGWSLLLAGDLAGASRAFDRVIEVDDSFADAYAGLCAIGNLQERHDEARRICGRAASMPGHELQFGPLALSEARAGNESAAREAVRQLEQLDPAAAALALATAYEGLGDRAAAIETILEADALRAIWVPALLANPYLLDIAEEPRIQRILDDLLVPHDGDA
ncbi:MAG: tetratricopeptide repeat protein [Acidobacteria bacterium]|nr:tetratricopeptide repeat protein [Acidobacteriota bacterium]